MTSSVATRRCWYAMRMACCLASSRVKTTPFRGVPSSPPRMRRVSSFPKERVPPVISTRLPSSTIPCPLLPPFVVGGGILAHLPEHLRPRRRPPAGQAMEPRRVEGAVVRLVCLWFDRHAELVEVVDQSQEVVFRYSSAGNVVEATQVRPIGDKIADHLRHDIRGEAREDGACVPVTAPPASREHPLEQPGARFELPSNERGAQCY